MLGDDIHLAVGGARHIFRQISIQRPTFRAAEDLSRQDNRPPSSTILQSSDNIFDRQEPRYRDGRTKEAIRHR